MTFRVIRPSVDLRPIVVHIPHSSPLIPPDVLAQLLPDDAELSRELVRLIDWHTDRLYGWTADLGATQFVNGLSRLVVDPERFADDAEEPMARVGQGVVYTRTTDGKPLRSIDAAERQALIDRFFVPYHEALTSLVADTLGTFGRCLILDCHSFATEPLPSEPDQAPDRPDICIGTDPFHTPPALADALRVALVEEGFRVELTTPTVCRVPRPASLVRTGQSGRIGDARDAPWPLLRRVHRRAVGRLRPGRRSPGAQC